MLVDARQRIGVGLFIEREKHNKLRNIHTGKLKIGVYRIER